MPVENRPIKAVKSFLVQAYLLQCGNEIQHCRFKPRERFRLSWGIYPRRFVFAAFKRYMRCRILKVTWRLEDTDMGWKDIVLELVILFVLGTAANLRYKMTV